MTSNKKPTPFSPLSPSYLSGHREALAQAIEILIDLMDVIDGDPDAEDADPGGGNVTDEPHDQLSEDGI